MCPKIPKYCERQTWAKEEKKEKKKKQFLSERSKRKQFFLIARFGKKTYCPAYQLVESK